MGTYWRKPCSKILFTAGQKTPLIMSVIAWVTLSSPAYEYSLLRSSRTSTNFAGNQPAKKQNLHFFFQIPKMQCCQLEIIEFRPNYTPWWPLISPIQQWSSFCDIIVIKSFLRKPNSSSSLLSKSKIARALFRFDLEIDMYTSWSLAWLSAE